MNRFISRLMLAVLFGLVPALYAHADACEYITADEAQNAEQMRQVAQTTNDFDTLEKIFSPDLIYVHSSSVVDSKQSYIESMRSGAVVYKVMRHSDVVVRTFGCIAILTGNGNYDVRVNGKDVNVVLRFHSVWKKTDGELKYVSWQSTRIP